MYFSACGAPKFALRSERAFEEIARAWRASLLWRRVHQFIWSPRIDTSEIHSSTCGIFLRMRRHYPAARYSSSVECCSRSRCAPSTGFFAALPDSKLRAPLLLGDAGSSLVRPGCNHPPAVLPGDSICKSGSARSVSVGTWCRICA